MTYRCKYCVAKFSDEHLTETHNIPKHMVVRGTDSYLCNGSNRSPR